MSDSKIFLLDYGRLPINESEHRLQNPKKDSTPFDFPLLFLAFLVVKGLLHLLNELVEDIPIHDAQQDKECGTDRAPNYTTNFAIVVEPIRHGCCGCGYNYGSNDDDAAILLQHWTA